MIRLLEAGDIPEVIRLGGMMHEESQYSGLTYNPEKVVMRCRQILTGDNTMLGLVSVQGGEVVGMLGACILPYDYGDELLAHDMLVYVAPDHRGGPDFLRMVKAYVFWAKECGAKMVFLSQTTGINAEKVSSLYERLGFKAVGQNHCLEVH